MQNGGIFMNSMNWFDINNVPYRLNDWGPLFAFVYDNMKSDTDGFTPPEPSTVSNNISNI